MAPPRLQPRGPKITKAEALAGLQAQREIENEVFAKRGAVTRAARIAGYSWHEIHTILGLL